MFSLFWGQSVYNMEMAVNLTLYDGAILYRILIYRSNYHGSVKRDPYSLLEVFSVLDCCCVIQKRSLNLPGFVRVRSDTGLIAWAISTSTVLWRATHIESYLWWSLQLRPTQKTYAMHRHSLLTASPLLAMTVLSVIITVRARVTITRNVRDKVMKMYRNAHSLLSVSVIWRIPFVKAVMSSNVSASYTLCHKVSHELLACTRLFRWNSCH